MNAITDEIGAEEMIRDAVKATGKPYVLLDEDDADSSILTFIIREAEKIVNPFLLASPPVSQNGLSAMESSPPTDPSSIKRVLASTRGFAPRGP